MDLSYRNISITLRYKDDLTFTENKSPCTFAMSRVQR